MDVSALKILVIGLGVSGKSAARFLLAKGAIVYGIDDKKDLLETDSFVKDLKQQGMVVCHESNDIPWKNIDLIVLSPGVPPTHPLLEKARILHIACIGEVELACQFIDSPCIAVTGTNGKTTVTLFIEHLLNTAGRPAKALGNVGYPLTTELLQETTASSKTYVIELSSFQLETLHSRILDHAVVLNITPDHMDRYQSLEDYAKAKIQIFNCLKKSGRAFIDYATYNTYRNILPQEKIVTYGSEPEADYSVRDNTIYFQGNAILNGLEGHAHDQLNCLVAFAICQDYGVSASDFLRACSSFKKPPHRVEFVEKIHGVSYYDDSKGTNIDAVIKAVQAFSLKNGDIYLIAGGVHKGFSYKTWGDYFHGKVRAVFAIGEAAPKIKADIGGVIPVEIRSSLQEAVESASKNAILGDIVLLSPGCSSYDMFKDYKHRGEQFQDMVRKLKNDN